ncbi:MAG: DEAD/DEAH box helicase [Clostridium sp.]|nr:DEAD/DEAH box helicase [Prevotella sp.]MCM1429476.1 DEAD/DEAH box helicase [Clostridium sp.]
MKEKDILPILRKEFQIDKLNEMQQRMVDASAKGREFILLSPTGSGKTIAFTLPMLKWLKPSTGQIQAVVIAPSRELVQQIFHVVKRLAVGYKVTPLYGGHKVEDEINSLSAGTDIVVATPGRLLDHMQRRDIDPRPARIVILDEFDKSLELGFEQEMKKILAKMKDLSRYILTSATKSKVLPEFLQLTSTIEMDFLGGTEDVRKRMEVKRVDTDSRDKLQSLYELLAKLSKNEIIPRSIIFVNHRESVERIYKFLEKEGVDAVLYHGQLDQRERETAIALFNNGTKPILVATDLAARGLDIKGVQNIIHYHQPLTEETFTHRNGRTARVDTTGRIYVLIGPDEKLQPYIEFDGEEAIATEKSTGLKKGIVDEKSNIKKNLRTGLATIYIAEGKKEKLSKGDILGYLTKDCGIEGKEVGKIDVFDHYSLVALKKENALKVIKTAKTSKIKGKKRRINLY